MTHTRQEMIAYLREVEKDAKVKFMGFACAPPINVTFQVRGLVAGYARYNSWTVDLNLLTLSTATREFMEDTISHEVAHMVAFYTGLGKGHNAGWKRIHRMLGGNGKRCYSTAETGGVVRRARRTREHLYLLPSGYELWIGTTQHSRLQSGKYTGFRLRDTKELILSEHYTKKVRLKA